MPPAVGLLMLKRRQSGVNPIRPIKETRADLIRLVLTWLWLTVPDFKKGGRGGGEADEWTSLLPPSFVPPSLHSRMALTQLIRGTWDVIRRTAELPEEFVQIANFANDKPGISMGFFAAFFGRETSAKEKKRSDMSNLHKFTLSARGGGAGWTCWPHSLPTHVTVKINGRHQRQPPAPPPPQRKETFYIHLYCVCVDQWRATIL